MSGVRGQKIRTFSIVYPYVRCAVPRCLVRTKALNEYGMCPIWSEDHDAYFEQMKTGALFIEWSGRRKRRSA